ncbi:hypothetical protein MUO66_07780 [Candidatus Bathyarchaeota archaeon]|nr:hypothetical protein [Candidatus Bathyarchaeota archaeon]
MALIDYILSRRSIRKYEKKVNQPLKIPDKWKVVALLTLDYPAEQPKQRKKKAIEKMFSQNTF